MYGVYNRRTKMWLFCNGYGFVWLKTRRLFYTFRKAEDALLKMPDRDDLRLVSEHGLL